MLRKAVLALALFASANAQVTKKVASFQVCGQYFTSGISAADATNFAALGYIPAPSATTAPNTWNTWKSGGAVSTGPLFAGACGTTQQTGTSIGRVVDICDPNVWQPIAVNYPCTLTRNTANAGVPTGGTCPGMVNGVYAAPTADQVKAFCQAQTVPFPTAATTAAFCRGEIDIIGTGKYAGHALTYDYTLTPTYTVGQGAHTGTTGTLPGGTAATPSVANGFVTCVYYATFAATTGRAIVAEGKYFKNGWIKKLVASVTIAPTRIVGGPTGTATTDFNVASPANNIANTGDTIPNTQRVPADTTGLLWAETITVTYVKPYYNLQFL